MMTEKLIHEIIPVGMLQCNCSILGDPVTREALVVDPGDEVDRILEVLQRHKLTVRAIISTHTHIDHVGGLAKLHAATGAPVLIHEADMPMYERLDVQAQFLGMRTPPVAKIDEYVKDGDTLRWGGYTARVIHTPGHSPGSISLFSDAGSPLRDAANHAVPVLTPAAAGAGAEASAKKIVAPVTPLLLAGDTLFQGSIGRTDLWGGSMKEILNSIREKLLVLPEATRVIAGHGDETTIGAEREENPFLQ
jgi:glyoxylase-like metal-dependent hydrolase (beta-lactamase superfamily II)